jgi:ACS family tartrate transporter-like MFS transporter
METNMKSEIESRTMGKIIRRFVPLLTICFICAFLDRVNVGFAALTMNKQLGFSSAVFGLGAGLFFLGYFVFEVPSNMLLERFGARRWIARIMLTWGLVSGATAFIHSDTSFYVVRVLLGVAEAGFFPGIIFFFTLWIPKSYSALTGSTLMAAMPLASVIGSPISGLLMSADGLFGLHGWQIMFLLEAIPSLILAVVVFKVLRDKPEQAEWLAPDEKKWLVDTLERERRENPVVVRAGLWNTLRNPVIIFLAIAYFGVTGFNYGMSFFLPQIVKTFDMSILMVGFVSALPFVFGAVGMVWWGRRADRAQNPRFYLLLPLFLAMIGLAGSTLVALPVIKLALICLASFGVYSAIPVFWTVPQKLMGPATAAAGIAFVNSVGNLSGFVNPWIVGLLKDATGKFDGGLQVISVFGLFAIAILGVILQRFHKASQPAASERAQMVRPIS